MPSVSTQHLGVMFDDNINFREHNSQICQTCYFHIHDLQHIRWYLHISVAITIATTLVYYAII